jgi:hypothetical protein
MLLDNDGDAAFIFTPKRKNHAFHLYQRAVTDDTGRWAAFHFTSFDNPHLSKDALAEITATPTGRADTDHRVRHDRVSHGSVSLRVNGQLHHIGLGRPLNGTPVILLIADLDVRIIHAATGELLRQLTIDPQRRYHGTGRPPGGPTRPRKTRQPEP